MKKNLSIAISLTLIAGTLFAQKPAMSFEVNCVKVSGDELKAKIENFVELEKSCEYYSEELLILVSYKEIENTSTFNFESTADRKVAMNLNPSGYAKVGDHGVLFYGMEPSKNQFLTALDQTKKISVADNDGILVNDDSYSVIQYRIVDGNWEAFNKMSRCY